MRERGMGDELPVAVATRTANDVVDKDGLVAVHPVRVGIGAGVLAAIYLLVIYIAGPVPCGVVAWFGGATDGVARYGGLRMTWLPPAGYDPVKLEKRWAGDPNVHRDRDAYVVEVPGVKASDSEEVGRMIAGEGALEFHEVLEAPEMKALGTLLNLPMHDAKPVDLEIDQWRPDGGQSAHTDYYLRGETKQQLADKLAEAAGLGWHPPVGTHVAFERFETEKMPVGFRTYVISDVSALDGSSIKMAEGAYDPNTGRPVVLLDFTREGAQVFGDLTSRIRGHKLAIVVGGAVKSAPIINDAIRGGRASITMGGSNPLEQEHQRDLLVKTLRAGILPLGGTIVASAYVAPADQEPMIWLSRLAIALGGGALLGLLVWALVRITRPVRNQRPARVEGSFPIGRIAVTLLAPLAIWIGSHVRVLGIDSEAARETLGPNALRHLSIGIIGLMPIMTASVLVEIFALIIPGWRRRRHAGPDARRPLLHATIGLALALTVIQGWTIALYFDSIELLPPGTLPRMLVMGSLGAGTLVLVLVAAAIREHGVGNGFGALLVGAWAVGGVTAFIDEPLWSANHAAQLVTAIAIAVPVAVVVRWRTYRAGEAALRLPSSGIAPLGDAGGLTLLLSLLAAVSLQQASLRIADFVEQVREHRSMVIGLFLVLGLVWSAAFARPAVIAKPAERLGLARPAWSTWLRATVISVALLVLIGTIAIMTGELLADHSVSHGIHVTVRNAMWLAEPMTIAIATAWFLDVLDDLRARRVSLDLVWTVHQPQYADLVVRSLADGGIPCHLSSSHLRTLFAFFAPFVPIDVRVAPEHVPEARVRLDKLFE